jgi:hypothetical protein
MTTKKVEFGKVEDSNYKNAAEQSYSTHGLSLDSLSFAQLKKPLLAGLQPANLWLLLANPT